MDHDRLRRRIERHRRRLTSPTRPRFVKWASISALTQLPGDGAEEALLCGLDDSNPRVRGMVAVALTHRQPPVPVERIVERLRARHGTPSGDVSRPLDACEALEFGLQGWSRIEALEIAARGLRSGDRTLGLCAVELLRRERRSDELLEEALEHNDEQIREKAREVIAWRAGK